MAQAAEQAMIADEAPQSWGWLNILFGFRGRIGRGRYLVGLAIALTTLFLALASFAQAMNPTGPSGDAILAVPLVLVFLWIHLAITIKRFRDAGGSAWLGVLIGVGPIVWVVLTVELVEVAPLLLPIGLLALFALPIFPPQRSTAEDA